MEQILGLAPADFRTFKMVVRKRWNLNTQPQEKVLQTFKERIDISGNKAFLDRGNFIVGATTVFGSFNVKVSAVKMDIVNGNFKSYLQVFHTAKASVPAQPALPELSGEQGYYVDPASHHSASKVQFGPYPGNVYLEFAFLLTSAPDEFLLTSAQDEDVEVSDA